MRVDAELQSESAEPKSLADAAAVERRRELLSRPHIAALRPVLDQIRARHGETPDPDPLDGGAEARLLLLLETPGPRIRRTGFVSRDNPAETSANLFRALAAAGIARRDTLIWNAIPWVIHREGALNRAPTRAEIATGLGWLEPLLACLPRLAAVVLAGRVAGSAELILRGLRPDLPISRMPHPSPTYLCTNPAHPLTVAQTLRDVATLVRNPQLEPPAPTLLCPGRVGPKVLGGVHAASDERGRREQLSRKGGSPHPDRRCAVDPPPAGESEGPRLPWPSTSGGA